VTLVGYSGLICTVEVPGLRGWGSENSREKGSGVVSVAEPCKNPVHEWGNSNRKRRNVQGTQSSKEKYATIKSSSAGKPFQRPTNTR